jgi:hypothetical protein
MHGPHRQARNVQQLLLHPLADGTTYAVAAPRLMPARQPRSSEYSLAQKAMAHASSDVSTCMHHIPPPAPSPVYIPGAPQWRDQQCDWMCDYANYNQTCQS